MAEGAARAPVKIVVVGDPEVGKTSVIKRLVQERFTPKYKASTGVDFYLHEVLVNDELVRLQLWDVAGKENRRGTIAKAYYNDAFGAMVIYDVTRPSTFDTVAAWKKEIDDKVSLPNGHRLPVILVGNKYDLETAHGDGHHLDKYCEEHKFVTWYDVSAKTGYNVDDAVKSLAGAILQEDDIFDQAHRKAIAYRPANVFEPADSSLCSPS